MFHSRTVLAAVLAVAVCRGTLGADLAELAQAKPGTVVEVPAGVIAGGFSVPPGVALRGPGTSRRSSGPRGRRGDFGRGPRARN